MKQHRPTNHTVIFSGGLWAQRQKWRYVTRSLPPNTCLLIFDPTNEKQMLLMRRIARCFRGRGRRVRWVTPNKPGRYASHPA